MSLKFLSLDSAPALLFGNKAWELSPDNKSWVPADLTEASVKGRILSPGKFTELFGKVPTLPFEIVDAYARPR